MKKSFPFEYEAYIAGTAFLNRREKGAYVDLLCFQADKADKGKGHLTFQDIQDVLNGDFDCWEKLKSKFIEENGLYYNKKLESVKRGKQKKTEGEIEIDRLLIISSLNKKKMGFYNDCKPYLGKYPKEMLRRFYDYWTETNRSGTKLRYELQQTFEIGKRLATWASKDKEFKSSQPKTHLEMLKLTEKNPSIWSEYNMIKENGKAIYIHK